MITPRLDTSIMDTYMMEKKLLHLVSVTRDARQDNHAIWEGWEMGRGSVRLHFDRRGHLILTIG